MDIKKVYILITLSLLYLTFSLACDPLAFRLISILGYTFSGSALLYVSLYTILDILTRMVGRNVTIKLILLFHLFDLLFTYILYLINLLPTPVDFNMLNAYHLIIDPMPRLFWAGIIGAIFSGIIEVVIYSFLQKRFKSFFLPSVAATLFVLLAHNLPTDYISLHKIFPDIYLKLMFANFSICCISVIINSAIASLIFSIPKVQQSALFLNSTSLK